MLSHPKQLGVLSILLAIPLGCLCQDNLATGNPARALQKTKPSGGRFVRVSQGYMVPFTVRIPGSHAHIQMMPVPGARILLKLEPKGRAPRSIQVNVGPFWMAKTEITWAQYAPYYETDRAFRIFNRLNIRQVDESSKADAVSSPSLMYDENFRRLAYGGGPSHPAAGMTQFAARQYTKYLSKLTGHLYRLPSALEWEHACYAGTNRVDGTAQPGNPVEKKFWHELNSGGLRQAVGRFAANGWGLQDMQGNVAEWVLDQEKPDSGTLPMQPASALAFVVWPKSLPGRIAMGGSFLDRPEDCQAYSKKASNRDWWEGDPQLPVSPHWLCSKTGQGIGFRIICPLDQQIPADMLDLCWEPDCDEIRETLRSKYRSGYTTRGLVDADLPKFIQAHAALKKEDKHP